MYEQINPSFLNGIIVFDKPIETSISNLLENCMIGNAQNSGLYDDPCNSVKWQRSCVCQFQEQPILKLRGGCKGSFLNIYYTLKNNERHG